MTPAEIRAMIAKSDGGNQGEILEAAWDLFAPDWSNITREKLSGLARTIGRQMEANAYTDAALLIAEAVLPGCHVTSSEKSAIIRCEPERRGYWYNSLKKQPPTRALAIIDAVCAAKTI